MVKFPQDTMEYFTKIFQKKIWSHGNIPGIIKAMLEHPQQERHRRWLAACREQAQARAPCPWQSSGPTASSHHGHVAQFTGGHISATRFEHSNPHVCSWFHTCVYLGSNHVYSLLTEYFTQCSQQGPLQTELQMPIKKIICIFVCVCAHTHTGPQLLRNIPIS